MLKKIIILSIVMILGLLVGCSDQTSEITSTTSTTTVTTATTTTITTAMISTTTFPITTTETTSTSSETTTINMPIVDGDEAFLNLETFTLSQLTSDFDYAIQKYEDASPKLFTDTVLTELIIEEQRGKLVDGMNEVEFLRVLAPIIASINCAHSGVYVSRDTYQNIAENGKFFALDVRIIQDEIVVIDNSLANQISVGSVIKSINGISATDIINVLISCNPSDGQIETTKYERVNEDFRTSLYSFVDASSFHVVQYTEPESDLVQSISIAALTIEEIYGENRYGDWVPFEAVYSDNYAILNMNSFYPFGEYTITAYKDFIDEFFLKVDTDGIENVILDVRDNGGGDPMVTSHLFNYLAKVSQPYFSASVPDYYSGLKTDVPFEEPHFNGNLYTIMNGLSGSSSGHLLALLKYQDIGVFVGVESGASYVVTDSTLGYTLFRTGLNLRISRQAWDVAVSGLEFGRGIMPDYEYELSLSDYLSVEDEILQYTIGLID
ncbi:S41 family peptidase [Mycoplasmatota bacterium WC30]